LTKNNKLTIAYFYKDLLNLYGDNGNVEILEYRALKRNIPVEIININVDTDILNINLDDVNLVFMGGGPDSSQKELYVDLIEKKGDYLKNFITNNGVGLYICGAYQLLGHYYLSADGSKLQGLGIFDLYTRHFGSSRPRCIGNTIGYIANTILDDPVFKNINTLDDKIVGFENHGGRTYLQYNSLPMANILMGYGNNAEDHTEGVHFKNSLGTYFHGPFLARNPHIADYLIAKALGVATLTPLDDTFAKAAHTASQKLKQ
jgi:lipid II isoglutaminyl synthase (glutamine-hydrolysing)